MLETDAATVLVDFGMFQGDKDDDARNVVPGDVHRATVDAVLLTHGHLDHSGRLPMLIRDGYRGPIYCTQGTRDIAEVILNDAAHIQVSDYERKQRRAQRSGRKLSRYDVPLFDQEDVDQALSQIVIVEYGVMLPVAKGMQAVFHDAGHLLGSASVELRIQDADRERIVVFSGDVGPQHLPFLRDPEPPMKADVVVLESTYGDRDHRSLEETLREFQQIIVDAVERKGKIFIPSFAIGRAQQMMFHIAEMVRSKRIPAIPIFLDSPMAIKADAVYRKHTELFDAETSHLVEGGQLMHDLRSVRVCVTADESKAINDEQGPFIVIAGSGMCTAGRIMHHIRNSISDPTSHFVIVGYQARGSLGRKLVDGAPGVKIMGEYHDVRAQIHTLGGFSAHAGQTELLDWFGTVAQSGVSTLLLTHGEDRARNPLRDKIQERFGVSAFLPAYSEHCEV
jgi:metallo-beta-lactamase family protein